MKKLMILALAFITINAFAQRPEGNNSRKDGAENRMQRPDFTPEQQATLLTKKLTLDLDLTASQQKQVYSLNIAEVKERQANREAMKKAKAAGEKPTDQERYDHMIAKLDHQISVKSKMKSILNTDQYAIWESKIKDRKRGRGHNRGDHRDRGHKGPENERRG